MTTPSNPGSIWRPDLAFTPAAETTTQPAWRQLTPPLKVPPRVRLARLMSVFALILLMATLLIWVLLWLVPPGAAVLILAGAGYEANLTIPENARGREAMMRFSRLAGTSSPLSWFFPKAGRLRLAHPPLEFNRAADWAHGLDEAREQTVVVFLAMHGGTDARGAYLLPQDATADIKDRIHLELILDRLARLPQEKHKLLILDATAMQPNWTLGLLHDNFARGLADLDARIAAIPNLVVLSSSDLDQRSWPEADLRLTLFARHLFEGLLGKADFDRDNRVHVWELYQYVRSQVETDARRLHGVEQTPVLLPQREGEARARAISVTFRLDGTALENISKNAPLEEIQSVWSRYEAFRPRTAAARACVPGEWALWQAWLLRHEQLSLAGSPYAAAIAQRASEAGQRVRLGLELDLVSSALTLEMPAVQGQTQLDVPYPYGPEDRLWQSAPADRQRVWQSLRQEYANPLLRRNILFALIRRAAENPARNLARAAELVKLLDDPVRVVRPAEAHFLVLLQRDLPVRPIPEELNLALQEALRVRLLAEQAALAVEGTGYAYAERIWPWIETRILQADARRQQSEDLLFASQPSQWQESRKLAQQARQLYDQAKTEAVALRECFAVCDRALAQLPILAHWVAQQSEEDLFALTKSLLEQTRQLDEEIQKVVEQRQPSRIADLRQRATAAQAGLDQLQSRLDAFARKCETSSSPPVRDGLQALAIPWLDAETRTRLLVKLHRLERQARSENEAKVEQSAEQLEVRCRRQAIREGQLAMAALGPTWFDATRGLSGMSYADVEPFLRRPDLEGAWDKVLRWVGDEIGHRFRAYPSRVHELVVDARKQQRLVGSLRQADRLQRRFSPGQWQQSTVDAPVLTRRAEVEQLLLWMARRGYNDHWYNDDPTSAPYYQIAGIDYLRDVRRLDPFQRTGLTEVDRLRKELEQPDGLRIETVSNPSMIAGDRLVARASLRAQNPSAVTGRPMLWAMPGEQLAFVDLSQAERTVIDQTDKLAQVQLVSPELERAEQSPPFLAAAQTSQITWHAYYRGQKPSSVESIMLYPVAELTRNEAPPPARAGVCLRAVEPLLTRYGEARGGLAIVVDCSGSEGPLSAELSRSRFRQATAALKTILQHVPRGTRLSLWIFGQAVLPRKTVRQAEDTIQQLRPPAIWNGGEGDVEALVAQVEAQETWNESPIARALLRAREDLVKVEGFREMIVLSDGDDNRFAKDTEANPKKESIAAVLNRRFADTNIAIHFVGFADKDGKPEPALVEHFGFVTTRLPKGTISTVNQLKPLLEHMRWSMPAGIRYRLRGSDYESSSELVEATRPQENDRWTWVSGGSEPYRVEVPQLGFDRTMTLRPGDFVLLELEEGPFGWKRQLYSRRDAFARRPARQTGGWRAALLQNQILGEQALQMMLTLEQETPRTADPGQVYPGAVWLEVAARGSNANPAVRWGRLAGYPAPSWGIDVPGWPTDSEQGPPSPEVRVWWADVAATAKLRIALPRSGKRVDELLGPQTSNGSWFTIDRVGIEQHWVEVSPGTRGQRWCLVVAATHPLAQPVWAELVGMEQLAGQEHRHYRAAGRYVGLFWFSQVDSQAELEQKIQKELKEVAFISVGKLKTAASHSLHQASFADLDTPSPLPSRPSPVWSSP